MGQTPALEKESNRQRELYNIVQESKHERNGLKEAYGLRAKGGPVYDPAATTQLYEGIRPGNQQFGDQAYPFQDVQGRQSGMQARENQYDAIGPAATTQLYEGVRPGTQRFGDQAYPFQDIQGRQSGMQARYDAVGPAATTQLYEGVRPGT